jgi:hypothetical protein
MRALIERYVAGDTATDAQRYLSGAASANDNASALRNPSPLETERYINKFLSIYPSSFGQVERFANACAEERPDEWRPMSTSRQTVNGYFLRLGGYCWQHIAEPYLAHRARDVVRTFDEVNQTFGLIEDDLKKVLVSKMAERYVKQANGTLFAEPDVPLRYGHTIVFLTERAQKFQGLSIKHCREHMAWAFLLNSVRQTRGFDDRPYAAQYLTSLLMKKPM